MKLPDYSAWLTPERLAYEEFWWSSEGTRTWPVFVTAIEEMLQRLAITSIVEWGCGTGWVAAAIPPGVYYLGLDANAACIELARKRCSAQRDFAVADVRTQKCSTFGLVCAFSFLKHFGLGEWDEVVAKVLSCGQHGLFSIPLGSEDKDDGTEFPHVWVTVQRLEQAARAGGHEVLALRKLPWGETMVTTGRVDIMRGGTR